ncbi:ATP-binding protein [Eisenbergiella sp.]
MKNSTKARRKKSCSVCILAGINFLILLSVSVFLYSYQQLSRNIQQERRDYVSEISGQLDSNISMARLANMQLSTLLADVLSTSQPDTFEECCILLKNYAQDGNGEIFFATSDGLILTLDGTAVTIDNRDYISRVLRQDNYPAFERVGVENEYWLFSSLLDRPCVMDDQEIRSVILAWDKEAYSKNMTISIFDGLGYSFLIKSDGVITVSPEAVDQGEIGFNILTSLQAQGIESSIYGQLLSDLENGIDNSLVCELSGIQWLLQYHRLEEGSFTFIMLPLALTAAGTYQGLTATLLSVLGVFFSLFLLVIYVILMGTRKEKQRQKELYEFSLAQKAVEAKNDFLAKMSHDIRTPLNGIIGMNLLTVPKIGTDNNGALENLKKMENTSKYLLSLINDILDMSKIESGKMEIANKAFSLEELLQNIKNMLEITAAEKNLEFETNFHICNEYGYLGDALRINQILMNLLSNAFKFTQHGGVRLEIFTEKTDDRYDRITVVIADTGVGMSPEYLKNIFMPFLQESAETAETYGGSGLGLSIVKSLLDLMGGTISVHSEKGVGTEFVVSLPLERTTIRMREIEEARSSNADTLLGKRVLVAEDNELNAEITIEVLKMKGLEVEWVKTGKAAVERFLSVESGWYSLILMDIHMPEMDGLTAARTIRASEHPDSSIIPICALSANAFEDDAAASREAGMNDHLKKPLEPDKLYAALIKYIK